MNLYFLKQVSNLPLTDQICRSSMKWYLRRCNGKSLSLWMVPYRMRWIAEYI